MLAALEAKNACQVMQFVAAAPPVPEVPTPCNVQPPAIDAVCVSPSIPR